MKKTKYLLFLFMFSALFLFAGVVEAKEPFYNITTLYLKSTNVDAGGKIPVDLYMVKKDESTKINGYFAELNGSNKYITLEMKDVNTDNPYFELSSYMLPGEKYRLNMIDVEDSEDKITYSLVGGQNYMNPQGKNEFQVNDVYKLNGFSTAGNTTVAKDGKVSFNINTNFDFSYVSIVFRNTTAGGAGSIAYLNKESNGTYTLDLTRTNDSSVITDGDYKVTDIFFTPSNMKSGPAVHFSNYSSGGDVLPLVFNNTFTIKTEEQVIAPVEETVLTGVEVKSTTAKINDRVFVTLRSNKSIISAKLIFSNENESMTVNLKNMTSEPNFIVPYTTSAGTYKLDYAIIKTVDGKQYQYRSGEDYYNIKHFDFNSTLTIEEEKVETDSLNLDNSKITAETIENLKKIESNVVIEIDASNNPVITKELFETIKGSNKTVVIKNNNVEWTFNGLDVKEAKKIDVTTSIYTVGEENSISDKVKSGLVIEFAENEKLPGKCLIKLYNNEQLAQILNKNKANIYYYNEKTGKFEEIKLNAEYKSDGYYEFYISHNSKYVITTEKIDDSLISGKTTDSNKGSKGISLNTILLIAIPSAVVIILLIVFLVAKKKNKNNKKEVTKEEVKTKEDKKEE